MEKCNCCNQYVSLTPVTRLKLWGKTRSWHSGCWAQHPFKLLAYNFVVLKWKTFEILKILGVNKWHISLVENKVISGLKSMTLESDSSNSQWAQILAQSPTKTMSLSKSLVLLKKVQLSNGAVSREGNNNLLRL
jgi:hypothetical protein